jgi:hypothetical protein
MSGGAVMSATCSHCGSKFEPQRRSARFCRPACRVAAHRQVGCNANKAAPSLTEAAPTVQNSSRAHPAGSRPKSATAAPRDLSVTRAHAITPDGQWPGMYRIRQPDGSLSDMLNLTRAKDALLW